ncbi:hypothetical protein [Hydrogenovibrio marinus]|uniref:Uncharacterized protein n=1 Tax=Hydrogenovibrio marinus TaxID=28885 RepID=A0A066ZLC9_HYDMR|nr:hypothetical protein [Hydrogenovibrio marinus]KDN94613.1 hypothetical protein EI16_11965 [Hydrogenovibrio marinus]
MKQKSLHALILGVALMLIGLMYSYSTVGVLPKIHSENFNVLSGVFQLKFLFVCGVLFGVAVLIRKKYSFASGVAGSLAFFMFTLQSVSLIFPLPEHTPVFSNYMCFFGFMFGCIGISGYLSETVLDVLVKNELSEKVA